MENINVQNLQFSSTPHFVNLSQAIGYIFDREVIPGKCDKIRANISDISSAVSEFSILALNEGSCGQTVELQQSAQVIKSYFRSGFFQKICLSMILTMTKFHHSIYPRNEAEHSEFVDKKHFFLELLRSLHQTVQKIAQDPFECNTGFLIKKNVVLKGADIVLSRLANDPQQEEIGVGFPSAPATLLESETHFEKIIKAFEFVCNTIIVAENYEKKLAEILLKVAFNFNTPLTPKMLEPYLKECSLIEQAIKNNRINLNQWEIFYLLLDSFLQDIVLKIDGNNSYKLPNGWSMPIQQLFDTGTSIKKYIFELCSIMAMNELQASERKSNVQNLLGVPNTLTSMNDKDLVQRILTPDELVDLENEDVRLLKKQKIEIKAKTSEETKKLVFFICNPDNQYLLCYIRSIEFGNLMTSDKILLNLFMSKVDRLINLNTLIFGNIIESSAIPKLVNLSKLSNLTSLSFGNAPVINYAHSLELPEIPNLISLSFGDNYSFYDERSSRGVYLPNFHGEDGELKILSNLKILSFGIINRHAYIKKLPINLQSLSFGGVIPSDADQAAYLIISMLPVNLSALSFGNIGNRSENISLRLPELPAKLNSLSFGDISVSSLGIIGPSNEDYIREGHISLAPDGYLGSISFGNFMQKVYLNLPGLPDNVTSLSFGNLVQDSALSIGKLPENLNSLSFQVIESNVTIGPSFTLPANLKSLSFKTILTPQIKEQFESFQKQISEKK